MSKLDVERIRQAAAGRWPEILTAVGGIAPELLDERNHPCPKCGGTDRFRFIDPAAGALFCNQCFCENNGDGFAAVQWVAGVDFPEAVKKIGGYLGIASPNGNGKQKKPKGKGHATQEAAIGAVDWVMAEKADPPGKRVAVWHYPDAAGEPVAGVIRYDVPTPEGEKQRKTFRPVSKHGDKWFCADPSGSWPLYGLPALADATMALQPEGEKAADALRSVGLVATTSAHGAKSPRKTDWGPVAGKTLVFLPDDDEAGASYLVKCAACLATLDPRPIVKRLDLPDLPPKGDAYDFIALRRAAGATDSDIRREIESLADAAELVDLQALAGSETPRKLSIFVGVDEQRVVDEAVFALGRMPNVYQRAGALVHIVESSKPPRGIERPKEAPRIVRMPQPRLREVLATAARWVRDDKDKGVVPCHPPDWAVKALDARGQWQEIPPIESVVTGPILRADGTVLQAPGYDAATGLYFVPDAHFPRMMDNPTREDAEWALDVVLEIVADFPFKTEEHRAAWLAGVLTLPARWAFTGPVPLFLTDANVAGSGKTLANDAVGVVHTGQALPRMAAPRDDEEARKRITAVALAGEPAVLIDNVAGLLGSASLDAALTGTSWSDRILGRSEMTGALPLFTVWFATGNNVILGADTARRTLHIRLESPEERPEERTGFRHPDLLAWVRENRGRLAVACCTILRAFHLAGRPDQGLKPWGSFEGWSNLVRNAVVWCGMPDPGATREELQNTADRGAATLRQLIAGWQEADPEGRGMTVAAALKLLSDHPDDYEALRAAVDEMTPIGKAPSSRSIAMKLHHLKGRVIGGRFIDVYDFKNTRHWRVVTAGSGGSNGSK